MEKLIGLFILAVIYFLKAGFEARAAAQKAKKAKEKALQEQPVPQEDDSLETVMRTAAKRKKKRRKQPAEEYVLELEEEPAAVYRGTLNKTALDTPNTPQLAASPVEHGTTADNSAHSPTLNIQNAQKVLPPPDGIRQYIIWAEILKRPEW